MIKILKYKNIIKLCMDTDNFCFKIEENNKKSNYF